MKKIKKIKLGKLIFILITLVTIMILLMFIYHKIFPYYEVDSRTKKTKEFTGASNEKTIAWLKIQGTNIDLPIVYYYDSDVSDPTNDLAWKYSTDDKLTKKATLFSHNVLNVSSTPLIANKNHKRFEQLMSFVYYDFVKENKYIQYTTGGKDYLYKIYGVSFQEEEKLDHYDTLSTKKEYKDYVEKTKEKSYFDFDIDVDENDKLLTLVTCTRFFDSSANYSFVVDARLVRNNEIIRNYGVTEKKSYNRIKKILRGDEENV